MPKYSLTTDRDYNALAALSDFNFERYSKGAFGHDAIRAFNNNQSFQIDIYKGDGITTDSSEESSSGLMTDIVHLRMFSRDGNRFRNSYGNPHQINEVAHVSPKLLWQTSVNIFARYLDGANGKYNVFSNNCKNFCNELVRTLQAGETLMPDGYELGYPATGSDRQALPEFQRYVWILTRN